MRKALFIAALFFAALCAKAQNGIAYQIDTLTVETLLQDYVSLNQQIESFRVMETRALRCNYAGIALGMASVAVNYVHPEWSNITLGLGIASAACIITAAIYQYTGFTMLKRDRISITPDGLVIKLKYRD